MPREKSNIHYENQKSISEIKQTNFKNKKNQLKNKKSRQLNHKDIFLKANKKNQKRY